ncbi:MAG: UDP-N-acetylglucosamine--N-acetylmuramyl-(pentapeptide) pyrophosphoryl-undecaprenol N-acetylglucosamine transferase [Candidatus Wallbacteria bacterium]|nr:UDP-N-acetylglucosamine--N-acetylmuramyl-(pentapeptide) pyrophosphoryl-undecaprenol N-acetylglucosamine transferase [Candidatus Wallbacteria bacterium]
MPFNWKSVIRKTEISFNPLRPEFASSFSSPHPKSVLFVGGSQGSAAINAAFTAALPTILENGYTVTLLSGRRFFEQMSLYAGLHVSVFPYSDKIWEMLSGHAIIVSRCGALSISEIIRSGRVSVLIPYRNSAGNHQAHNAEALAESGAAVVLREESLPNLDWHSFFNSLESSYNKMLTQVSSLREDSLNRDFFHLFSRITDESFHA